jgi:hypothetical protein
MSKTQAFDWCLHFKSGLTSIDDAQRLGLSSSTRINQIWNKYIKSSMKTNSIQVHYYVRNILGMSCGMVRVITQSFRLQA